MKFLFFLFASFLALEATAQLRSDKDILSLFSSDQRFVKMALENSVYIVSQSYVLTDSAGGRFGRNENPFFGKKYSVGIMTDTGMITDIDLLQPWMNDKDFDKYRHSSRLLPKRSRFGYKHFGPQSFTETDTAGAAVYADSTLLSYRLPDTIQRLPVSFENADSSGWLVVATYPGTQISDSALFTFMSYKVTLALDKTSGKNYIKTAATKETILGGIYFNCRVTPGTVRFAPAGIIKQDDKGWYLLPFAGGTAKAGHDDALKLLEK